RTGPSDTASCSCPTGYAARLIRQALTDALAAKLWEVIHALAARNVFLHSTDHLSDRELYDHLVEESLHEVTKDIPARPGWTQHIDMIGSGSEEDIELYLRYYADDDRRRRWAADWPKHPMPPKEPRPCDRDRLLPRPKDEWPESDLGEPGGEVP
ncbi:MAG: hypothetical protein K2X87_19880, partial [Gemmataceae bacterium]|nr:hypothetical protein [Gemmataceae bacterium]